jgi:SAM-dependent methyltransferase
LCRAADLGCGAGHYANWLAGLGFDVPGVDKSPTAIRMAEENARKKNARYRFVVADLLGDLHEMEGRFDFSYDGEFLHHVFPEDRDRYLTNVRRITNPGGLYLSVSFSGEDPRFGGKGKYRKTRLGTTLCFSSGPELREIFSRYFFIRISRPSGSAGSSGRTALSSSFRNDGRGRRVPGGEPLRLSGPAIPGR